MAPSFTPKDDENDNLRCFLYVRTA